MAVPILVGTKAFELPPPHAIETRTCWLWNDGFLLRGRFKDGAEVNLDDALENTRAVQRVAGGARLPALIDLRWLRSQTSECRDHFSSPEAMQVARAVALLVESPLSRAIGNFYLGFNRPATPTRIFTDTEAARQWLHSYLVKVA